ncbi:MAG: hypothetical protein KAV41_01605, partial [Candidatus Pacebacteria bacterium]|nr:hypothetical protein [Candidatus Paceibacterota bacterium]
MKKALIIFSILFIFSVVAVPTPTSADTKAGLKPGNFFYFLDTGFEKINLFFIFNSEKKAEKALEYANERLAEIKEIAEDNKPELVEKALAGYEEKISLATEKSKEIKDEEKAE